MTKPVSHQFRIVVTYPLGVRQIGRARDLVSAMIACAMVRQAEGPTVDVDLVPDTRTLRRREAAMDAHAKQLIADKLGVPPESIHQVECDPLTCTACGASAAPLRVETVSAPQAISPETPPRRREPRASRRLRRLMRRAPASIQLLAGALPAIGLWMGLLTVRLAWRRFLRRPRRDR